VCDRVSYGNFSVPGLGINAAQAIIFRLSGVVRCSVEFAVSPTSLQLVFRWRSNPAAGERQLVRDFS